MDWISKGLSMLNAASSTLPFIIGEKQTIINETWSLHSGTLKADRTSISVFCFDCTRLPNRIGAARNYVKRLKTIKHPLLPKFIEVVETEQQIVFATELVKPLSIQLERNVDDNFICLGLYKIANIIKFLNVDCGLVHANIKIDSIVTTKSGEWKLMGLELLSSVKEGLGPITQFASTLPNSMKYAPPEIQNTGWNHVSQLPVGSVDTWQFGCLIYELFNGHFSSPQQLSSAGKIPQKLFQVYRNFISANAVSRGNQIPLLLQRDGGYFDNEVIKQVAFLEQWSLKEAVEKDRFIQKISTTLDSFPIEFQKYKILPELLSALEFGGASPKSLAPILKIGSRLEEAEFETLISPIIIKMFALPDRAIRITLCENISSIINQLSKKVVSDKIFPNLVNGFSDSSPPVREHTLKAILLAVPKLYDSLVNNDLLRHLAKLQTDPEPGIRTNTTICIGKISKHLNEGTRKKVLVPAFSRALQDPFPPARNAGLLAYSACVDWFDLPDVSQKIIPATSPLLGDSEGSIRKLAAKNIEAFLKRAQILAQGMPETAQTTSESSPAQEKAASSMVGWAFSKISGGKEDEVKDVQVEKRNSFSSRDPPPNVYQETKSEGASVPKNDGGWESGGDAWGTDDWGDEELPPEPKGLVLGKKEVTSAALAKQVVSDTWEDW